MLYKVFIDYCKHLLFSGEIENQFAERNSFRFIQNDEINKKFDGDPFPHLKKVEKVC